MGRTLILEPGVLFQENDQSAVVSILNSINFGIVTLASCGPTNVATLISSISQLQSTFGVPTEDYPGLLVARDILAAGGAPIYIVRVARGDIAATATISLINSSTATLDAMTTGSAYNAFSAKILMGASAPFTEVSATTDFATGSHSYPFSITQLPVTPGTVVVEFASTQVATDDGNGNLVFGSGYTAYTGTINYETGAVSIATSSLVAANNTTVNITGNYYTTFTLQLLETVNGVQYEVERYTGVNLANMVSEFDDSSNFLLASDEAWAAFPVAGTYNFSGGNDGAEEIEEVDYIGNTLGASPTGLQQFANQNAINVNVIAVPEASQNAGVRQAMIQLVEDVRSDAITLIDPPQNIDVNTVCQWKNGTGNYNDYDAMVSEYGASHYPYFSSLNPDTGDIDLTPPSDAACQALVKANLWGAPAGPQNGQPANIVGIERQLNDIDRETLGNNQLNPLTNYLNLGETVMGQCTLTTADTSLNRISARLQLCMIEKTIVSQIAPVILFQKLITSTFNNCIMLVQPYLNTLQAQGNIYTGTFLCDSSTNAGLTVDNILGATCALTLMKYAEIILITFQINSLTGSATITESSSNLPTAA